MTNHPRNLDATDTALPARRATPIATRWCRVALSVYWPALALATHWPRLDFPNPPVGPINFDKIVHSGAFALLATLMIFARLAGARGSFLKGIVAGTLIAAGYAAADEFTQAAFERTASLSDLVANLVGVFGAGFGIWWFYTAASGADAEGELSSPGDVERSPDAPGPRQSVAFVGHAVVVSVITMVSRVLGLARDAVMAACFGMTAVTDAFWIAFVVPNLFRRLFGEGALSAAFIPVYSDLLKKDAQAARRLAWLCVAGLVVVLSAVTVVGELVLVGLLQARAWSSETSLALRLTMVMLPYTPMVCVVALLGGVLQVHGRFGPPAAAPVVLNVAMIAAAVLATGAAQGVADHEHAIMAVSLSVLAAGLVQMLWQFLAVLRHQRLAADLAAGWPAMRTVLATMVPMVLALAVFQINTLLDSLIAWGLSPKAGGPETLSLWGWEVHYPVQQGAVTGLQYAQRLYQFPLGVFGIAIATAIFPALAHAASVGSAKPHPETPNRASSALAGKLPVAPERVSGGGAFSEILRHGLRLTVFVGLPASVGLILVRVPLARVMFERRAFEAQDAIRVATILAGYASGVWAYSMIHVLTRAFYALKNTRTPLSVSMAMLTVNVVLNVALVWRLGAAALAWSTALCAAGQAAWLLVALRGHVDRPVDRDVWSSWAKSATLTALMAAGLWLIMRVLDSPDLSSRDMAVMLGVLVVVGVAIVFGGARLLGMEELGWLLRRRAK